MNQLVRIHDTALDFEHNILIDAELLGDKRNEMYDKKDVSILQEIVSTLNATISDAQDYRNWAMQQLEECGINV